jgi:hypothetical protein
VMSGDTGEIDSVLGPFTSSPGTVMALENKVVVGEGRNLWVFSVEGEKHAFLYRIKDCTFLPITDLSPLPDDPSSFILSSMDGFISYVIV